MSSHLLNRRLIDSMEKGNGIPRDKQFDRIQRRNDRNQSILPYQKKRNERWPHLKRRRMKKRREREGGREEEITFGRSKLITKIRNIE